MRVTTRFVIILAIVASLFSFAKSYHCSSNGWSSPDREIHACYSDLPALYGERGLDKGIWAYSRGDQAVEYPVLQGTVMWVTAKIFPSGATGYFYGNAILLALLFIFTAWITFRIKPEYSYLLSVAPAVIASMFVNWDLWGIATMMLAIYWFDRKSDLASSIALGISIATKFFPIILLIPIAVICLRLQSIQRFLKYLGITALTFILINAPFALTTPTGWWRFYSMNLNRGSDWGSLWYALSGLGLNFTHQNYLSVLCLAIGITGLIIYLLQLRSTPTLADTAVMVMIIVMAVSKVYSPQYVLWLVPLAVIALQDKRDLTTFWVWQGSELLYHVAIWEHLALLSGARFGLPLAWYCIATLIRIGASLFFLVSMARRRQNSRVFPSEFLLSTAESYP